LRSCSAADANELAKLTQTMHHSNIGETITLTPNTFNNKHTTTAQEQFANQPNLQS
jgi:hypothetical protein